MASVALLILDVLSYGRHHVSLGVIVVADRFLIRSWTGTLGTTAMPASES